MPPTSPQRVLEEEVERKAPAQGRATCGSGHHLRLVPFRARSTTTHPRTNTHGVSIFRSPPRTTRSPVARCRALGSANARSERCLRSSWMAPRARPQSRSGRYGTVACCWRRPRQGKHTCSQHVPDRRLIRLLGKSRRRRPRSE